MVYKEKYFNHQPSYMAYRDCILAKICKEDFYFELLQKDLVKENFHVSMAEL